MFNDKDIEIKEETHINLDNEKQNIKKENNNTSILLKEFNLGANSKKDEKKAIDSASKLCSGFINNTLVQVVDDTLFYDGFEYKKIKKYYTPKTKINTLIFRCKNYRKDESNRIGLGRFCDAKIEMNIDIDIALSLTDQKFKIINNHSNECYKITKLNNDNKEIINEWEDFKNKAYNYLNNFKGEFNNKTALDNLKVMYNQSKYNFIFNNDKITKLIKNWQRNSVKFSLYTIFEKENIKNRNGEIFLRDFRYFYNYENNNTEMVLYKYAIWIDSISISHMRKSNHFFIDGTWYKPSGFVQILIILYKDSIINEKIPGCFIITNNKKYKIYKAVLESFKNILTQHDIFDISIKSITVDDEIALNNAVNDVFPNINKFNCYYHYKKNITDKLRKQGLLKRKNNEAEYKESKKIINLLGLLPIEYNGNMAYFNNKINDIKNKFPKYKEFIDEYFIKSKYKLFELGFYNYNLLPEDCRSNSYLENYNLYLKKNLGKKYNTIIINT